MATKIVQPLAIAAVALICTVATASGRSLLGAVVDNSDVFALDREILVPNGAGAITLDNIYTFDYARAGMGTVIFRTSAPRPSFFVITDERPRAIGSWTAQSFSFDNPSFVSSSPFNRGTNQSLALGDDSVANPSDGPIAAAPEPSTWFAAVAALVAMCFAQRRRLRGLSARRA